MGSVSMFIMGILLLGVTLLLVFGKVAPPKKLNRDCSDSVSVQELAGTLDCKKFSYCADVVAEYNCINMEINYS